MTAKAIKEFITMMAVCHTVVPEKDPEGQDAEHIYYQAASPGKPTHTHKYCIQL